MGATRDLRRYIVAARAKPNSWGSQQWERAKNNIGVCLSLSVSVGVCWSRDISRILTHSCDTILFSIFSSVLR